MQTEVVDNRVAATAPLSLDLLKMSLNNNNICYVFDPKNSKLKGKGLINYMCNLVPFVDLNIDGLLYEEKEELLLTWINSRQIKRIDCFVIEMAQLCLYDYCRAYNKPFTLTSQYFTIEEKTRFLETHGDLVDVWCTFIRSIPHYLTYLVTQKESLETLDEQYIVDDVNVIGNNVVTLFFLRDFVANYIAYDERQNKFYKEQFTKPVFKGRTIFHWMKEADDVLYHMTTLLGSGTLEFDKFANMATMDITDEN